MNRRITISAVCISLVVGITGCSKSATAIPQPTGTAAFVASVQSTKLKAVSYIKEPGLIHLGELICLNLQNDVSLTKILRDVVYLNGTDDKSGLTVAERSQFAIAAVAASVAHLCPDQTSKIKK